MLLGSGFGREMVMADMQAPKGQGTQNLKKLAHCVDLLGQLFSRNVDF